MPQDPAAPTVYSFGEYRLDASRRLLLRNGAAVPLNPKAFDTLALLVANRDKLLTKEEILRTVWPGTFVEENNLNQSISILRKALGEGRTDHRYIVTAPGHGYRFVAPVHEITSDQPDAAGTSIAQQPAGKPVTRRALGSRPAAVIVSVVLTIAAGVILYVRGSATREGVVPRVRTIAVLPFKSSGAASGHVAEDYLGIGMADALITRLGRVSELIVRPSGAVRSFGGPGQDPLRAGRELQVDVVLEGNIQRSGERVSVNVRLLSTSTGTSIWSDSLDTTWTEMLVIEDRIAERVVESLLPDRNPREREKDATRETKDPDAYLAYLRGRYFWNKRTEDSLKSAVVEFEEAIRRDGGYARAYAGLADTYILWSSFSIAPWSEVGPRARSAALRALQLNEQLAEAHTSLAFIEWIDCAWNDAGKSFRRAIELSPSYATAHHWYSLYPQGSRQDGRGRGGDP